MFNNLNCEKKLNTTEYRKTKNRFFAESKQKTLNIFWLWKCWIVSATEKNWKQKQRQKKYQNEKRQTRREKSCNLTYEWKQPHCVSIPRPTKLRKRQNKKLWTIQCTVYTLHTIHVRNPWKILERKKLLHWLCQTSAVGISFAACCLPDNAVSKHLCMASFFLVHLAGFTWKLWIDLCTFTFFDMRVCNAFVGWHCLTKPKTWRV